MTQAVVNHVAYGNVRVVEDRRVRRGPVRSPIGCPALPILNLRGGNQFHVIRLPGEEEAHFNSAVRHGDSIRCCHNFRRDRRYADIWGQDDVAGHQRGKRSHVAVYVIPVFRAAYGVAQVLIYHGLIYQ